MQHVRQRPHQTLLLERNRTQLIQNYIHLLERLHRQTTRVLELHCRLIGIGFQELPDRGDVQIQTKQLLLEGITSVNQLNDPNAQPNQAATARLQVLDACAAPGGKTAHLLELADCDLTALDIDAERCARIHETLHRLGLHAQVVAADAAQPARWWNGVLFDAILLDAPCTASGIVRRHPDVRWLRRETDIAQLAAIQARLLKTLWPLLKPGGRLLYCTCSVFRAEGEVQIQTFVTHNTDAVLRPSPGHLMPQSGAKSDGVPDNPEGDHDGFFYALLEKSAA